MQPARILVMQDEDPATNKLTESLSGFGYEVVSINAFTKNTIELYDDELANVLLVDLDTTKDAATQSAIERLHGECHIPTAYLTDRFGGALADRSSKGYVFSGVLKPVEPEQLHLNIHTTLSHHERTTGQHETLD